MKINDEVIVLEFKKKPEACRCCGREFDEGDVDFRIVKMETSVKDFFEHVDWGSEERFKEEVPYYSGQLIEGELKEMVREYVHGTINFYNSDSDIITIEKSEVEKMFIAVKNEVLELLT